VTANKQFDVPAQQQELTSSTMDRTVRITADHLTRLLGLAGESLVNARGTSKLNDQMLRLKRLQDELSRGFNNLHDMIENGHTHLLQTKLRHMRLTTVTGRETIANCLTELETFARHSMSLSQQLYQEVLAARMRPFADGIQGLPRMVRDVARTLGKHVMLETIGETTPVDRDILQRVEAPLGHILRNVVDHGIELPEERRRLGKPLEGHAILQARHSAGALLITIADDGRGVDPEAIRGAVIVRNLATPEMAAKLSDEELLEFLFLPGFSLKDQVTDISGRGVGLDVVQTMVKEVGGKVQISSEPGKGTRVQLQLPITLSVLRALIMEIAGQPYALPLARVARVAKVSREEVMSVEGHQHVMLDEMHVGLVAARHVLELTGSPPSKDDLPIVVVGGKTAQYGLVVDRLLGERELVVRPLDSRLGKVADVSAASIMPDGSPVLIIDVDDLIRSIDVLVSGGRLTAIGLDAKKLPTRQSRGHVLVVDDSITVRETERKLLESGGYQVDVAVDGMEAWNAVRMGHYDLIVTDVDMPRLDGIELTKLIRKDLRLKALPIMIVSYKDREEDRLRGLEAGADYYLTKASFQDDTLLNAAADLIGDVATQGATLGAG
jgi:two-component system sensor histidine kinase and response regulator WspE